MQQRVVGVSNRAVLPVFESGLRSAADSHSVILGVDPSLRGTGYGVIRLAKPHPLALAHGTISCPAGWERSRCLVKIVETLRDVLKQHQPTVCVIEGLFYAQNLQTAIIMGEARGAAQKSAVAKMVQRLLNLPKPPAPDAADALALALTHARENSRYNLTPLKRI